jgi:hypothetical protein
MRFEERMPVCGDIRIVAVDFQPGERLAEDAAMRQRALGARMGAELAQPALQAEQLTQPFDVAPGQRQLA